MSDIEERRNIKASVTQWFERKKNELIEDLGKLIAVKSVYGEPADGAPYGIEARHALEVSRQILRNLGFESTVFRDCMAVADLNVPDGAVPEVGLLVHSDVVAATGGGWTADPFTMDIRDGCIYGRGATDNKGPTVASIYAMACARDVAEELGLKLRGGARIIVGSSEEIGCVDIGRYLEEHTPPRHTFAPDANYPLVNIEKGRFVLQFSRKCETSDLIISGQTIVREISGGETSNIIPRYAEAIIANITANEVEKTAAEYTEKTGVKLKAEQTPDGKIKLAAYGIASHASRPQDGNNAQTALVEALAHLPLASCDSTDAIRKLARLFPHGETDGTTIGIKASDSISGHLTLAFTTLSLVNEVLTAGFDSRTPLLSDSQDIIAISGGTLDEAGFTVINSTKTKCHVTDADSDFVRTLLRIYNDYTGLEGEPFSIGGTTYVHDIPGGVAFGCEMPGADHRIHSADEFIPIETLITSGEMFAQAILEMA